MATITVYSKDKRRKKPMVVFTKREGQWYGKWAGDPIPARYSDDALVTLVRRQRIVGCRVVKEGE